MEDRIGLHIIEAVLALVSLNQDRHRSSVFILVSVLSNDCTRYVAAYSAAGKLIIRIVNWACLHRQDLVLFGRDNS